MSIFGRIFGRKSPQRPTESKASATGPLIAYFGTGQAVWTDRDFTQLVREGYAHNPIVYACVRRIARAVADIPIVVKRDGKDVEKHAILDLLSRPNPENGRQSFMRALQSNKSLGGNAYIERTGITKPRELYVLRNDRVNILTGDRGWPSAYEYRVSGRKKVFPVRSGPLDCDILHIRDFHPTDDYYGMSPLEAVARNVDIHNATAEWAKGLLDNSARPSGAVVYAPKDGSQTLTDAQYARLKTEIEESHTGAKNSGRPMLLEGGLSWTPMGLTPAEMDFINTRRELAREIALAFGVPPMVLGIPGDNTYANYSEANAAFHRETVLPEAQDNLARLGQWLAPAFGDESITLEPDLDQIPALAGERKAVWDAVAAAGDILTTDERREAIGYGKIGGKEGEMIQGVTPRDIPGMAPQDEASNDPSGV